MGLKARLSSYCTKRANNGVNLVTSRKINKRLARPIKDDFAKVEPHPTTREKLLTKLQIQ